MRQLSLLDAESVEKTDDDKVLSAILERSAELHEQGELVVFTVDVL